MNFIKNPNIPEKQVSKILIDKKIQKDIQDSLEKIGVAIIKTDSKERLYSAVNSHPDMSFVHIRENIIVVEPTTKADMIYMLEKEGFRVIRGETVLESRYPKSIHYNVCIIAGFAIHNTKYTDPILRELIDKEDMDWVHVNQGYSKCSISVVNKNSIITSDNGIAKIMERKGFDVLHIPPQKTIKLKGLDYGFIGGASGLLKDDIWALTGALDTLESAKEIEDFIKQKNLQVLSLTKGEVWDIGSIIPLITY